MNHSRKPAVTGVAVCMCLAVHGNILAETSSVPDANYLLMQSEYSNNVAKYGKDPRYLLFPGVVADREQKRITVLAQATGLKSNEIVEFHITHTAGGHDYESLATTFVKPSDIHKALAHIGLVPGEYPDPAHLKFWPKGERVFVSFAGRNPPTTNQPVRLESLVADSRTGKALPLTGFTFTGSPDMPVKEGSTQMVYAADACAPNSVVATYNEKVTVLMTPEQAPQGAIYGQIRVSPLYAFPTNDRIDVIIEPEYKDGRKRVVDLSLGIALAPDSTNQSLTSLVYSLSTPDAKPVSGNTTLKSVLGTLQSFGEKGQDPFVSVRFDDGLRLDTLQDLCSSVLFKIDNPSGIRIDSPPEGCLYYRAFMPSEANRPRSARAVHPWELLFEKEKGTNAVTLVKIEESWVDAKEKFELKITPCPVSSVDQMVRELGSETPKPPVLLVFAPEAMTYGELMKWVRPAMRVRPLVHIYRGMPKD